MQQVTCSRCNCLKCTEMILKSLTIIHVTWYDMANTWFTRSVNVYIMVTAYISDNSGCTSLFLFVVWKTVWLSCYISSSEQTCFTVACNICTMTMTCRNECYVSVTTCRPAWNDNKYHSTNASMRASAVGTSVILVTQCINTPLSSMHTIIIIVIITFWPQYSIPREEKLCYAKTKYENKLEWSLLLLLLHKTIKK